MADRQQHDQSEFLRLFLQQLLEVNLKKYLNLEQYCMTYIQENVIPETLLHSYKCTKVQCQECQYQAEDQPSSDPILLTHLSPNMKQIEMGHLVSHALSSEHAPCPECLKRGKTSNMWGSTSPDNIEYPELLLVVVVRYLVETL